MFLENVDLGWAGAREPRGWGEYYDWVNILDATEEFADDKPILLLIIPEDCDDCVHCRSIREEFKNDQELLRISKHFHVVNFLGDAFFIPFFKNIFNRLRRVAISLGS